MPAGRKKKCRTIEIDFDSIICTCFGPLKMSKAQLKTREQISLEPDELQSLVYQDIEGYTMDEGCKKMGVSKTVYAGIYQQAKTKVVQCILQNKILLLECSSK